MVDTLLYNFYHNLTTIQTSSFFTIALGVDVGLFKALVANNSSPKKSAEIASAIGFDVDGLRESLP